MIKKQILTRVILFYTFCMFFSCGNKTMFDNQELAWVNTYETNDKLIFKNLNILKEVTILISEKKIYHKEYNPIASELAAHTAELSYKIEAESYEAKLIEMYKKPKELATPIISFLGSTFLVEENQLKFNDINLNIVSRNYKEVYIFHKKKGKHYSDVRHKSLPQTLYWDKEYGIIKYVTYNGEIWERINW